MEILSINAGLFWFLLGVALLVLEALTPGFVIMFFGVGAWAVSLTLLLIPLNVNQQVLVFIVVSVACLLLFRHKLRSFFFGRMARTDNMDDPVFTSQYIGREVVVIEEVRPDSPGLVELNGTNWNAKSEKNESFAPGDRVKVVRMEGLTLIVAPIGAAG